MSEIKDTRVSCALDLDVARRNLSKIVFTELLKKHGVTGNNTALIKDLIGSFAHEQNRHIVENGRQRKRFTDSLVVIQSAHFDLCKTRLHAGADALERKRFTDSLALIIAELNYHTTGKRS